MNESHRIRLRGFWSAGSLPDGRETLTRRFGRPRTLDVNETAWLIGERVPIGASLLLNGAVLGSTTAEGGFAFEITSKMEPRNEVTLVFSTPVTDAVGDDPGEVALEIRSA